jgi:hypothetical protein
MKNKSHKAIFAGLMVLLSASARSDDVREFRFLPESSVRATVTVANQEVSFSTKFGGLYKNSKVSIDSENPVRVEIDDYNFDGFKDFSLSHVDDGQGTYSIYRIFVYSRKTRNFVEIQPKCGDEFINIKLDKKNKTVINSYYSDNVMTGCSKKY